MVTFKKTVVALSAFMGATLTTLAAPLPDGYSPIEYLESTGAQSINLNMSSIKTPSEWTLEIDFQMTDTSSAVAAFGGSWSAASLLSIQGGYIKYFGNFTANTIQIAANDRVFVRIDPVNGFCATNYTAGITKVDSSLRLNSNNPAVFDCNNSTYRAKMRLYSLKIWDADGVLVRDMVPCVADALGTLGLYDAANGVFYEDVVGTTPFLRGKILKNVITISGFPGNYGAVMSRCGENVLSGYGDMPLTPGAEFTSQVENTIAETETTKSVLTSWKLRLNHASGESTDVVSTSADDVCRFTVTDGDYGTLVYNWDILYRVTIEAHDGLSLSESSQWKKPGETITVTVTERDAPFTRWDGDVPAENKKDKTITLTVNGPLTIKALSKASSGGPLPAGYIPVEYLESTGNQSIALGISTTAAWEMEMNFSPTSISGSTALFGGGWGTASLLSNHSGTFKYWHPTEVNILKMAVGDMMYVRFDDVNGLYAENVTQGISKSLPERRLNSNSQYVFACGGTSYMTKMRLYSLKIWDPDDVLVRDMVPCYTNATILSDGVSVVTKVSGLYDTVNGKFYTSVSGNNDFVLGTTLANAVTVESTVRGVGEPTIKCGDDEATFGYGIFETPVGKTVTATMPTTEYVIDSSIYTLTGWKLYVRRPGGEEETITGTTNICTYEPAEGDVATLTWQWKIRHFVSISAERGLKVSINGEAAVSKYEIYADAGSEFTVTYIEDGGEFYGWGGDVSADNGLNKTLSFKITKPLILQATTKGRIYVAAGKSGDGSSWENAYGTVQEAFAELASKRGADLYIASGTYLITETLANGASLKELTIEGGFTSDGTAKEGETVIARSDKDANGAAVQCQVMALNALNVTLDSLVISNGFISAANHYGLGLGITGGSTATITNCAFRCNGQGGTVNASPLYGAALGINASSVLIYDCDFADNRLWCNNANNRFGGAVAANNSAVTIRNSRFDRNMTYCVNSFGADGGAIALLSCNDAFIDGCTFTTNFVRRGDGEYTHNNSGNHSGNGPFGGSVYLENSKNVRISDSTMIGGTAIACDTKNLGYCFGGFVYVNSGSSAVIEKTKFFNGAVADYTIAACKEGSSADLDGNGSVDVSGGTLVIKDCLFAGTRRGWFVGNQGGTLAVTNCTFAGHQNYASHSTNLVYIGRDPKSTTFKNCIVWDNEVAFRDPEIATCTNIEASYSIIEGGADTANSIVSVDPKFVDPANGDYHLKVSSPARNKGDSTGFNRKTDFDLDGNKRWVGRSVDMGSYECQQSDGFFIILK